MFLGYSKDRRLIIFFQAIKCIKNKGNIYLKAITNTYTINNHYFIHIPTQIKNTFVCLLSNKINRQVFCLFGYIHKIN